MNLLPDKRGRDLRPVAIGIEAATPRPPDFDLPGRNISFLTSRKCGAIRMLSRPRSTSLHHMFYD